MAKNQGYSKRLVNEICALIKEDTYTVAEICAKVKISESSYYKWKVKHTDFTDAIKRAEDEYRDKILVECSKSLSKLVSGYTVKEKKTVMVDSKRKDEHGNPIPIIREQTVTEKHIAPNLGAIIHYQTNKDPQNWKNRQSSEVTGKDGKDLIPPARILTKEEAAELLSKLEDEC